MALPFFMLPRRIKRIPAIGKLSGARRQECDITLRQPARVVVMPRPFRQLLQSAAVDVNGPKMIPFIRGTPPTEQDDIPIMGKVTVENLPSGRADQFERRALLLFGEDDVKPSTRREAFVVIGVDV